MLKWLLPAVLLSGCATGPDPYYWMESTSALQEDIENRSLTGQIAPQQPGAWHGFVYDAGNPFSPYPDFYYGDYGYYGAPFYGLLYGDGFYAPLFGGLYGPYGSWYGPSLGIGGGYALLKPRTLPPVPAVKPGSGKPHAAPHPGHRPRPSGVRSGRGRR
jgi:hypothetical protein